VKLMSELIRTTRYAYYPKEIDTHLDDDELEPYMALFQKPLTCRKSGFSRQDLAVMCRDPLHSPRLIQYLIDFVKAM
jgi:hypothetical protein